MKITSKKNLKVLLLLLWRNMVIISPKNNNKMRNVEKRPQTYLQMSPGMKRYLSRSQILFQDINLVKLTWCIHEMIPPW